MSTSTTTSNGIGFMGMLLILFIGLKLAGVIQWSWWWVFSPLLIHLAIAIVLMILWVILKRREYRK
jgi:hypothetical protein